MYSPMQIEFLREFGKLSALQKIVLRNHVNAILPEYEFSNNRKQQAVVYNRCNCSIHKTSVYRIALSKQTICQCTYEVCLKKR